MILMAKYLTTEVQSCRFIYYGCQLYVSIPWGDILDLSESCPECWAGRIFPDQYSTEWYSPCIICVQYHGDVQYRGGVQYRGDIMSKKTANKDHNTANTG